MGLKVGDEIIIKGKITKKEEDTKEINVEFQYGYNIWLPDCISTVEKTYEQGLADAWELAKKIQYSLTRAQLEKIFGTDNESRIMDTHTPEEALAKIEAYEKEKSKIEVGSVVKSCAGGFGIVTRIEHDKYYVVWRDGSCNSYELGRLTNTGKMEKSLKSLLRQIGE